MHVFYRPPHTTPAISSDLFVIGWSYNDSNVGSYPQAKRQPTPLQEPPSPCKFSNLWQKYTLFSSFKENIFWDMHFLGLFYATLVTAVVVQGCFLLQWIWNNHWNPNQNPYYSKNPRGWAVLGLGGPKKTCISQNIFFFKLLINTKLSATKKNLSEFISR